jgi:hypothetical protein
MTDDRLSKAARSLAAHLREHFEIEGQPAPPSGGATKRMLGLLWGRWAHLRWALRPEVSTAISQTTEEVEYLDALERVRWAHGEIGRLFGFDQSSFEFSGKYPVVPLAVVNALDWAADRISGKQAEPETAIPADLRKWIEDLPPDDTP